MDATPFLIVMGAVMAANILSVGFVWSLVKIHQREKNGGEAPILYLLIVVLCLAFIIGGLYLANDMPAS